MQKRLRKKFSNHFLKTRRESPGFRLEKVRREGRPARYVAVRKKTDDSSSRAA